MDIKKAVNIVCLILGIAVICFGFIVKAGILETVSSTRFLAPVFLGFVIVLWSVISLYRNR
ncbi:MAG: hypothetical protein GX663_05340 [Clostridiales bacterium]|nr:hypothetical protein [Clostridiales bacterium]